MSYNCVYNNQYDIFSNGSRKRKYKPTIDFNEHDISPLFDADKINIDHKPKYLYDVPSNIDILSNSMDVIDKIVDNKQKNKVIMIISTFEEIVVSLKSVLEDMSLSLPPLVFAIDEEDNSILIEWIFTLFRIGFSVEKETTESFWYLVSSDDKRGYKTGEIREYDLFDVVLKLFEFVLNQL